MSRSICLATAAARRRIETSSGIVGRRSAPARDAHSAMLHGGTMRTWGLILGILSIIDFALFGFVSRPGCNPPDERGGIISCLLEGGVVRVSIEQTDTCTARRARLRRQATAKKIYMRRTERQHSTQTETTAPELRGFPTALQAHHCMPPPFRRSRQWVSKFVGGSSAVSSCNRRRVQSLNARK